MAKREFLMLAHNFKDFVPGCFVSEKLDGQRAFWDGGISRGKLASEIPWANTQRDARYLEAPRATGLWSRYGKVIHAPQWWLDVLPEYPLDGELYLGRGTFQKLRTIVSTLHGIGWESVKYYVFDIPCYGYIFSNGEINTTNFKKRIVWDECRRFVLRENEPLPFWHALLKMEKLGNEVVVLCEQKQLKKGSIFQELDSVCDSGGEGLMLRRESSIWKPERTHDLIKMKKLLDAEAIVIGYVFGKESDNTRTISGEGKSKLLGKMGALIVNWNDKVFELSGFTDSERELSDSEYASQHPGEEAPDWILGKFVRGSKVTFRYRELSDDGIPKEARFWRKF